MSLRFSRPTRIVEFAESVFFANLYVVILVVDAILCIIGTVVQDSVPDMYFLFSSLAIMGLLCVDIAGHPGGPSLYFRRSMTMLDFMVTVPPAITDIVLIALGEGSSKLLIVRSLRLLRLLRVARVPFRAARIQSLDLRRLLSDLLSDSSPIVARLLMFLLIIWMLFGAIGMLFFGNCVGVPDDNLPIVDFCAHATGPYANWTRNQLVNSDEDSLGFYQDELDLVLNFNTFGLTFGSLFALTIGNDIGSMMNGYALVVGSASRLYFFTTWIVFNIFFGQVVVAKLLDRVTELYRGRREQMRVLRKRRREVANRRLRAAEELQRIKLEDSEGSTVTTSSGRKTSRYQTVRQLLDDGILPTEAAATVRDVKEALAAAMSRPMHSTENIMPSNSPFVYRPNQEDDFNKYCESKIRQREEMETMTCSAVPGKLLPW
mmetsp:Transcript_6008/g.19616  ORF Transcript_6008/g.19616 Transcript_6008/m.19616 type:complete len:432 (-) Transcript_6008:794-2089(-)